MLKFENTAQVGDFIRAYNFQPVEGRQDSFVMGWVVARDVRSFDGYALGYKISFINDSEGFHGFVPYETDMDYDSRVLNLSTELVES